MPGKPLDQLIERARSLTEAEILALGKASDHAAGFFGADRGWNKAVTAMRAAAKKANKADAVQKANADVTAAVLDAAIAAAESHGRAVEGVRSAYEAYRAATDTTGPKDRARVRTLNDFQRAAKKGLGRELHRRLGTAFVGASAASAALITWKLAGRGDAYTLEHRTRLSEPWRSVAPLPEV